MLLDITCSWCKIGVISEARVEAKYLCNSDLCLGRLVNPDDSFSRATHAMVVRHGTKNVKTAFPME